MTVYDFYADWCGPCRDVDREMVKILAKHADVGLRKINVVDWKSPVARQYLRKVRALPYVIVHGRRGKHVASISGLKLKELRQAIARGRSQ